MIFWTHSVANFFDNASVGAFLGAAAAFLLIVANDWRRIRRRARVVLPAVLRREGVLVENRIAARPDTRGESAKGRLIEHRALPFSIEMIRRQAEELADHLNERQTMGLYNIALTMQIADDLSARAVEMVQRINETRLSDRDTSTTDRPTADLSALYHAELSMLKAIRTLIHSYLEGKLDEFGGAPDPHTRLRELYQSLSGAPRPTGSDRGEHPGSV